MIPVSEVKKLLKEIEGRPEWKESITIGEYQKVLREILRLNEAIKKLEKL